MIATEQFDQKAVDEELLKNGFEKFDDWPYGLECCWSESYDIVTIQLMATNKGYWILFHRHASGANTTMNIGLSSDPQMIIRVRDLLRAIAD